ncbi:hypothetical protein evm_007827 [Chilo suppressalis]|nr:hypothetical protein evm_007827 [Chilo suppressalis]
MYIYKIRAFQPVCEAGGDGGSGNRKLDGKLYRHLEFLATQAGFGIVHVRHIRIPPIYFHHVYILQSAGDEE